MNIWPVIEKTNHWQEIVTLLCNYFLGTPYKLLTNIDYKNKNLEQLLEQLKTQDELTTSLDSFDCVTLVDTILALTLAKIQNNKTAFQELFYTNLKSIRYKQGIPVFFKRNYYFMCVDWIPNNSWLVKDITQNISKKSIYAHTIINKLSWLYNHPLLSLYKPNLLSSELDYKLKAIDILLEKQQSVLPYIPSEEIINNFHNYLERFPQVSIVNIVRPNWSEKVKEIGTNLNISHLGFAIKEKNNIKFYHANSIHNRNVTTINLCDYLVEYTNTTVKGINVLEIKL